MISATYSRTDEWTYVLTVTSPDDLDRAAIEQIAHGARFGVADALLSEVESIRRAMLADLDAGTRVYGVNTGMGYLSTVDLTEAQQQKHSERLLLSRAVGSAPWLSRVDTRALMAVRLTEFLRGHSGVSADLCRFLVDRLNDGFCPAVPAEAVGTAGEIQPLAHAFQTFIGVGSVLHDEGVQSAAEALHDRHVAPYELGPKEGVALLAGAPAAAALTLVRLSAVEILSEHALVIAAQSCQVIEASMGPFDPAHAELSGGDRYLAAVLNRFRALLDSDGTSVSEAGSQAPVSFRVVGQALAHLSRTTDRLGSDVDRHLRAVTDSPVYVKGRFLTSGAFHAVDLTAGMDQLAILLCHIAEISVARLHRLMDRRVTGLSPQLAVEPGAGAGLIVVHKRAVGILNELRRLAAPAMVGLTDTSLGQEDAQTFTFEAAVKLRRSEELLRQALACEALAGRQARWLADRPVPTSLQSTTDPIDELIAPIKMDRPLGPDLDALIDLLDYPVALWKTNTRMA